MWGLDWRFVSLRMNIQLSQHDLLKRSSFLHWVAFSLVTKNSWMYLCTSNSQLSVLFYWSMCLFIFYEILPCFHIFWLNVISIRIIHKRQTYKEKCTCKDGHWSMFYILNNWKNLMSTKRKKIKEIIIDFSKITH